MQARPLRRRASSASRPVNEAIRGRTWHRGRAHLLRLRGDHPRPSESYSFLSELRPVPGFPLGLDRDRPVGAGPRACSTTLAGQDDHPRPARPFDRRGRDPRNGGGEDLAGVRVRGRGAAGRGPGLRHEVSAPSVGLRQARGARGRGPAGRRRRLTVATGERARCASSGWGDAQRRRSRDRGQPMRTDWASAPERTDG